MIRWLTPALALVGLVLTACSASTEAPTASNSDAVTAAAKATTPAHFVCTTTDTTQWPLELLTQSTGAVDATYGGGVVLSGSLQHGTASLGQFLSGAYAVTLDSQLLAGKAGTAMLSDDEGPDNGGTSKTAYSCAPQAPVATTFDCTPADSSQYPLSITTAADGKVVADYAGGAISWDGKLAGGNSDLGQFLSGEYSLHVDTDILDGQAGGATLFDDEGTDNGGVDALAYSCAPKK